MANFRAAVADCQQLLGNLPELAGFNGSGPPLFTDERIVFNGRGTNACEPFEVAAVEFDRRGRAEFFSFCKTEYQPYDLHVKTALIVLEHHLRPQLVITSDAPDEEWADARRLVQDRLGYGQDFKLG
ncbi:MAG TPA: hypothetical protein VHD56_17415 [Tepidisphaeraceae bacterium]|nr:hypothetical protein [Tepidisphaeraceae bacterium]